MRARCVVCLIVLVLAGCSGTGSPSSGRSGGATAAAPPAEPIAPCVSPQEQAAMGVAVQPEAGGEVDALIQGTGATGIVFANMSDNDLCPWLPTARLYAKDGYRVAVFAYSARQAASDDVAYVAAELRRRGATKIVLVGASKGGTASIVAAPGVHPAAVVELSAPLVFEAMDAESAVTHVSVPTWFGVGEQDDEFVDSTKTLYARSPATTKQLELVPSSQHGTGLLGGPVDRMLSDFLHAHAPAH